MTIESALKKTLLAIPSINGGKLLERMLPTLRIPPELVVVLDQGSTDETEAVCRKAGVELVQLGHPHTYTKACNIGAEMAKARGCDFVFIANNDITFTTDVMRELLTELLDDPNLGIVAPAQLIIDEVNHHREFAYRAFWDLETLTFAHDFTPPRGNPHRLESDFCELTFVGVRLSIIDEIGFLDDAYGFYHEDADFGFRLRQAGYSCAYLPNSQIEHWTSSTMAGKPSKFKLDYLVRNKKLFAQKHLDRFVSHADHRSRGTDSWNIINKNLHPRLRRDGFVHPEAPELVFSHPGVQPFDILYTVWETSRLPAQWLEFKDRYKLTLTTSHWGTEVLKEAGFERAHYAPLGIDTDVFHPWGVRERFTEGRSFLWFSRNQHRKGLDVVLAAWKPFHAARPGARLILLGTGIMEAMPSPTRRRIWKNLQIADYSDEGISVYEVASPLDEDTLATIYRSVDFTICSSRAEGFGFSIAESMANGTPAIFGNYSSMKDFVTPSSLVFDGEPSLANYSDKSFTDVGHWWEPSVSQLTERLFDADALDAHAYRHLSNEGVRLVRSRFTWRNTSFAIRNALIAENQGKVDASLLSARVVDLAMASPIAPAPSLHLDTEETAVSPPSRLTRSFGRMICRVGNLTSYFGTMLERDGWAAAISSSWQQLVVPYSRRRAALVGQMAVRSRRRLSRHLPGKTKESLAAPPKKAVLFIGYAEGALGLGQAFRANLRAAAAAALPFAVYPFTKNIETRLIGPFMKERYDTATPHAINVIEVAADQVPEVFGELDPALLQRSYNILCTYWELPRAPEAWRANLANIHEIWAPNVFIADAFAPIFEGPIKVMPPAMEDTGGEHPARTHYGMEENRLYFLFSFDYYSSPFRKNPMGVLKAFQRAFPMGNELVGLVIKSTGAPNHYPEMKAAIQEAMQRDPRILSIDKTMDRDEMLGLIRAADVYVSLHRAEGFGLGMAEAMTFGRIVMGTNYSGCTDFLTPETGYPVPYRLRPLEEHEYPWSQDQSWAEPDEDAAVEIMRHIQANPGESQERGAAAQTLVLDRYSPATVGAQMRERIDTLLAER